jgi:hypothetical protein
LTKEWILLFKGTRSNFFKPKIVKLSRITPFYGISHERLGITRAKEKTTKNPAHLEPKNQTNWRMIWDNLGFHQKIVQFEIKWWKVKFKVFPEKGEKKKII